MTPVHQAIPPAKPVTTSSATSPPITRPNEQLQQPPLRSTPLRRSSSPNLSPSKRLFHSPPLTTAASLQNKNSHSLPPRPSSTPVNNNNYSVTVTVTSTTSEDEDGGPKMPIKPSPIRLHPNDPVWRPF